MEWLQKVHICTLNPFCGISQEKLMIEQENV